MSLEGRVAVVTGGGGGIGEGICLCLAKAGADVVVSDIREDLAREVAAKVEGLGRRAVVMKTDVTDEGECQALIETALRELDRLCILVCCAGTAGIEFMSPKDEAMAIENIPLETWDRTIDVNLKGVFLCNRAVIPHFKSQQRGKIINISSIAGRVGRDMLPIYAASKAAVINLTQGIALQLAPHSINVNAICPGLIWTPLWADGVDFMRKAQPALKDVDPEVAFNLMVQGSVPFKRPQTPEDMGELAVFLASDAAKEITGQAINVDGGSQMN
jgi:meso-butanediol dehydrogenase/(S,S)-butanediol dehydrogenase/diacetyl reductase